MITLFGAVNTLLHAQDPERAKKAITKQTPILQSLYKQKKLKWGAPIFIRIFKESNELEVWVRQGRKFKLLKTYPIYYYSGYLGPKLKEGDKQAPEGFYYVTKKRLNPKSRFHLSFNIGYPNAYDRFHGRTGSALMVHGSTVSHGCFAMTNPLIEEIYTVAHSALGNGQRYFRVHIFPFRMTKENIKKHKASKWMPFWKNLKTGYDYFEKHRVDPNVEVKGGKYVFD